MHFIKELVLAATTMAMSHTTDPVQVDGLRSVDIAVEILDGAAASPDFTFISGIGEVQTLTFEAKDDADDGDYIVFAISTGTTYAVALDKDGVAAGAPTGAIWTAIPAARKSNCDVSAASTAATVAAAVELCVDAITGMTGLITTNDTANDGTMLFTQVESGPTTDPVPHNTGDTGAGGIVGVQTTEGVAGDVHVANDLITETAHGLTTGQKITDIATSSALPTGLSTSTAYYPIVVDADTFQLATTQANALAGTEINITAIGVGTQTVDVAATIAGTMKLQKNIATGDGDDLWIDIPSSSTTVDDADDLTWSLTNVAYGHLRVVTTLTSGAITAEIHLNGKD